MSTGSEAGNISARKIKKSKKRKISKHIADAKSAQTPEESPPKKAKATRDPQEALNYLVLWKNSKANWKFNKNTQTWLIRHMYDVSKVPKHSFEILLEYLQSGSSNMERVTQDATKRALCYQNKTAYDAPYDALEEHDKRKIYKRARKVLDALENTSASSPASTSTKGET